MTDSAVTLDGRVDPLPGDFFDLLKPRVMSLVVFTAFAGILLAPAGGAHPVLLAIALMAIAVGAGASGALNMAFDGEIDAKMTRTAERPVPAGKVSKDAAFGFGMILSVGSVMTLWLATNITSAALLAFTIFFYAVVYTLILKHRTPQNIVIGGAAGALPPVVGWAAVTGTVALEPLILFLIIFLWTPAHFWALAILKKDEYRAAGVPMLPVVASPKVTRWNILVYAAVTGVSGLLPAVFGMASVLYAVVAAGLGVWFTYRAVVLLRAPAEGERRAAGRLFGVSIVYLFALFGALMVDHALWAVI